MARVVFEERVYETERPVERDPDNPYKEPVEHWTNKTLMGRVCRETPNGMGRVICSEKCESYDRCRIGHEFVRRGLGKGMRTVENRPLRQNAKNLTESEKRLADRLRAIREELGLGEEAFARKCGIAKASVVHWETGRSVPSASALLRVLDSIGYEMTIRRRNK